MEIKIVYLRIRYFTNKKVMKTTIKTSEKAMKSRISIFALIFSTLMISQNILSEENLSIETKPVSIDNTEYYLSIADTFMVYKNLEDGLWALNKAIKCNPIDANIYHKRAMLLIQMAKFGKAIKDLNMAINLGLETAELYNHLGIANYYTDDIEASEMAYNKSIELNPLCAKAFYNRGILRLATDDVISATIDFQKAMEINTNLSIDNPKSIDVIASILQ